MDDVPPEQPQTAGSATPNLPNATSDAKAPIGRLLFALLSVGFITGYFVGQNALGERYTNDYFAKWYVAQTATGCPDSARGQSQGRVTTASSEVCFVCSATTYRVKLSNDSVRAVDNGANPSWLERMTGGSLGQALAMILGGKTAISLKSAESPLRILLREAPAGKRVALAAASVVLTASGFSVGYWVGLNSAPDCGRFRELQSKADFWPDVVKRIKMKKAD